MVQYLNMDDYVTPNHWGVERFESCCALDPKEEFELIAPVLIFFEVDASRKERAHAALTKLHRARHPLLEQTGQAVASILRQSTTPDGLINRYNALVMWLADEVQPGIESYIDEWGAYAFRIGRDDTILAGDARGMFAFFDSFSHLQERIHAAVDAAEEEEAFA